MEAKKMKILEALQMQPLSEEEKTSRHILGRLYGPIATTKEKTRNGRGYNKELWEKHSLMKSLERKLLTRVYSWSLDIPLTVKKLIWKRYVLAFPRCPRLLTETSMLM